MMTQNADKKREQIRMFCMDDMIPQDYLLGMIDKDSFYPVPIRNQKYVPDSERD